MGITTKTVIEYHCDKCGAQVPEYFSSHKVDCGEFISQGDTFYSRAYVAVKYEKDYAGNQIICNQCAIDILTEVINRLESK